MCDVTVTLTAQEARALANSTNMLSLILRDEGHDVPGLPPGVRPHESAAMKLEAALVAVGEVES